MTIHMLPRQFSQRGRRDECVIVSDRYSPYLKLKPRLDSPGGVFLIPANLPLRPEERLLERGIVLSDLGACDISLDPEDTS